MTASATGAASTDTVEEAFDLTVGELEHEISQQAAASMATEDTCHHPATCASIYCC